MSQEQNSEIHLVKRPKGLPTEQDFKLVTGPVLEPKEGEILVQNKYMSVDPYMRGRMNKGKSYIAAFSLNAPLEGGCVGEVIQSKNKKFQKGDYVQSMKGWRKYFVSSGKGLQKIDPNIAPIQNYLSVLGMTSFTAYAGLLKVGKLKEIVATYEKREKGENKEKGITGETKEPEKSKERPTVFVSGAAGAVGSMVCQIAKLNNCKVIGTAGTEKKIKWLREEIGIDEAINYKTVTDLTAELHTRCPEGVDLYFDNVGGALLDAALGNMKPFGTIVVCGMISQYNLTEPEALKNITAIIGNRLTIRGMLVGDHYQYHGEFLQTMREWIEKKQIIWEETIMEGLENAPAAFLGLFSGKNTGKMLIKID